MRQHHIGNREVIVDELALGDAVLRKQHAVGMGDMHAFDLVAIVIGDFCGLCGRLCACVA